MSNCEKCSYFFKSREDADETAEKAGNCVMEKTTYKGVKYWISKPIRSDSQECAEFKPRMEIK